jgi:hypothetical protein
MPTHVTTVLGYEAHEDGDVVRLVKDGVTITLPGPGADLQEVLDAVILAADSIAKRRSRDGRFKRAPDSPGCAARGGGA